MLQPPTTHPTRPPTRGAAVIEYVLLLALFTLVAIPGIARLRQGTEDEVRDTATDIGGTPVGTTPPPVTRDTLPPTTTAAPNALVIDAGPDFRIAPGQTHIQGGSVSSPNYPVTDSYWKMTNSGGRDGSTLTEVPMVGGPESFTTDVSGVWTRPGSYPIALYAKNQFGTRNDVATVKVTSGYATPTFRTWGEWYSSTRWRARGEVKVTNQYGYPVPNVRVNLTWTTNSGQVTNTSCTTNSKGTCTKTLNNLNKDVTTVTLTLRSMSGPCLDDYDKTIITSTVTTRDFHPWVPPTTTTTTKPPATTTTKPPATTTTKKPPTTTRPPATTTTRSTGPNG